MIPSVMVLVKNEAYWLPYVLKQCEGIFDSYVIYDVGSTDHTRDVIDWFVQRNHGKADIFVRVLPHVDPVVQGTFRNSMIAEGQRDIYMILDGDELYKPDDLQKIKLAATDLLIHHTADRRNRYGVVRRVEVNPELTHRYSTLRGHHRLYTRDAFWTGNHPGEIAGYKQNDKSEIWYNNITCWHMHNTLRSPREKDAVKRIARKMQRSYHPGELVPMDLLKELPALKERIEGFPVTPALEALWG